MVLMDWMHPRIPVGKGPKNGGVNRDESGNTAVSGSQLNPITVTKYFYAVFLLPILGSLTCDRLEMKSCL